jgi:hypothetical protein
MTPLEPLCEYCSEIPFDTPDQFASVGAWSLGPAERVKRSTCPLCEVVVRAFQTLGQTETAGRSMVLSELSEVKLYWFWSSGPGGRGAFTVDPSLFQNWICMVSTTASSKALTSSFHFAKSTINAEFDVGRLSQWISTCTRTHSTECSIEASDFEQSFSGLHTLRFVDVKKESVVELHTVPQYAALSYVWGEVASIRLTTGNRPRLLLPGGIRKAWDKIPKTIKDAIELVRRLDARYLWVDALCLIQNDPGDIARGVNVMDEIYERSWLTIIAAHGHNANAGLQGIREGSRFAHTATRITHEVSMGMNVPLDRLLKCSVYNSRAWT